MLNTILRKVFPQSTNYVHTDCLEAFKTESRGNQEKRDKAIAWLRRDQNKPRYILDGAKVSWGRPSNVGNSGKDGCGNPETC